MKIEVSSKTGPKRVRDRPVTRHKILKKSNNSIFFFLKIPQV